MPKRKSEKAKKLRHQVTNAKKGLRDKKRAFTSVSNAKTELVRGDLNSKEKRREYSELVTAKNDLVDEIKTDTRMVDDIDEQLEREERTPLGWLWYYITSPFRALWNILQHLSKPLTTAGEQEGLELLAVEMLEEAVLL